MDSRVPKNEREWWASREIEKLERELTETERLRFGADADRRQLRCDLSDAKAECDLNRTRLASIFWSGAMDKHTGGDVQKWAADYTAELARLRAQESDYVKMIAEVLKCEPRSASEQSDNRLEAPWDVIARLRAELAAIEEDGTEEHNAAVGLRQKLVAVLDRAEKAEADNAYWQKLLLMSRDDREIDLISELEEQARLLGMSGEREADLLGKLGRLESELAAIKNGHGELGKYEQLRLKNAELQRDKARLDWLAVSDTWFDYPATESFNPETFRDAIDAAMKGTP
jgi:hypothetical protein